MFGTKSIKELLDYGFSWVMRLKTVKADDSPGGEKVTWGEVIGSIGLITKIPKIIGEAKEAKNEFLDLDEVEIKDLKNHFADKFDIPNDKLEATFEDVWEILLRTGNIIKRHTTD